MDSWAEAKLAARVTMSGLGFQNKTNLNTQADFSSCIFLFTSNFTKYLYYLGKLIFVNNIWIYFKCVFMLFKMSIPCLPVLIAANLTLFVRFLFEVLLIGV